MIKRKTTKAVYCVCIDTTGPYPANPGSTFYWMCDFYCIIYMSWLYFAKRKSEMVKFVSNLLGILKIKGIKFEYLCCDNAGEDISELRTLCQKKGI